MSNTAKTLTAEDALRKDIEAIIHWKFATDGRKFNGDHKEALKMVIGLAEEAQHNLNILAASLQSVNVCGEDWVELKEGNPLPDFDEPVLWLRNDGEMLVESLDKDGYDWIYSYRGESAAITHWRKLPSPPQSTK